MEKNFIYANMVACNTSMYDVQLSLFTKGVVEGEVCDMREPVYVTMSMEHALQFSHILSAQLNEVVASRLAEASENAQAAPTEVDPE